MKKFLLVAVALLTVSNTFAMSDSDELTQLVSKAPKIAQECIDKSLSANEESILYKWQASRAKAVCDEAQKTVPECFGKKTDAGASILAVSEEVVLLLYSEACQKAAK